MIGLVVFYLIMSILTSAFITYYSSLMPGDEFLVGFLSLLWPIILPVSVIGILGQWISDKLFDWNLRR